MARLNLASPTKGDTTQKKPKNYRKIGLKTPLQRRFRDASPSSSPDDKDDHWADASRSTIRAPRTTDMLSQVKSRSQRMGKKPAGGIFDIFSDSDGASDRDQKKIIRRPAAASRSAEETSALKLAPVNSMLLAPLQQQSRGRQARKSETYDYSKENDPTEHQQDDDEYHSSISRNPSDASSRRSPTRRTRQDGAATGNEDRRGLFLNYRQPEIHLDDGESEDNGFDSMDDFIVSDNENPGCETSDDDRAEEDVTIKNVPPPKPKKRLIKGRRPSPEEELKKALQNSSQRGTFILEPSLPAEIVRLSPEKPRKFFQNRNKTPETQDDWDRNNTPEETDDRNLDVHSDSDDPSSQLQQDLFEAISKFEAPSDQTQLQQTTLETPPSSPSNRLRSPTRHKINIPPTPYRESVDAFWSQEATNDWVDQHSPHKLEKFLKDFAEDSDDNENEADRDLMPRRRVTKKEPKGPSKTALKKAEVEQRKAALARRKSFDGKKAALAEDFFKTLDDAVTGGRIQQLAEETGGVQISWSKTLQTTAGRASWKREKQAKPEDTCSTSKHHATIELAERIIDSEDRLLNTLAHEYCHLANFMISNIHNNPHGASFKLWGYKCKEALKGHPVYGGRVEVTTKHSYKIDYKYVWCCVDCGQNYGRHSKSIDTTRARCGKCQGLLQQIKPKPRNVLPRKKPSSQPQPAVDDVVEVLGAVSLQG